MAAAIVVLVWLMVVDRSDDILDGRHRLLGRLLDGRDLTGDLVGRLGGLTGQMLDFAGDDGEALAGIAGPRRLDSRIERQQIGLGGDAGNDLDDGADLLGRVGKFTDRPRRLLGALDGGLGHLVRMGDLPPDLADRGGQLFGRRRNGLHVDEGPLGGRSRLSDLRRGLSGHFGHRF